MTCKAIDKRFDVTLEDGRLVMIGVSSNGVWVNFPCSTLLRLVTAHDASKIADALRAAAECFAADQPKTPQVRSPKAVP